MKREIKFRGKRVDNGEWVYGDLMHDCNKNPLINIAGYSHLGTGIQYQGLVIPETVGQFTGLFDMNGREIYEGDTVDYVCDRQQQGIIIYDDFGCVSIEFGDDRYVQTIDLRLLSLMEIIGNTNDNPELLTKK